LKEAVALKSIIDNLVVDWIENRIDDMQETDGTEPYQPKAA